MDPTYITILVNGTNATNVLSTTATLIYNTLGLLPILILLAAIGIIVVVIDIALGLAEGRNHKNKSQVQQQVQQDNNVQQQNNKGIFIDFKTFRDIEDSIDFSIILSVVIAIIALIGLGITNNIAIGVAFLLIILAVIFNLGALSYQLDKLHGLKPKKVKKIIKETVTYSDGTTIEREKRYEY